MLTYDLKIAAERLNTLLATESPFITSLRRLCEWNAGVESWLVKIAAGAADLQQAAGSLHSHLASTASTTSEVDVEGFFASSADLSNLLKELFPPTERQPLEAIGLVAELGALRRRFSTYIARQSGTNALPLLIAANAFSNRLTIFQEDLNYFADSLGADIAPDERENELSLVFHSDQSLHSFWAKLKAVEDVYRQLCSLLEIDEKQNPLRIAKIESGSEWINLLGHALVVGVITKLLVETFKFAHRNYTREGRIAGTKASTQQVEAIIAVITKLDKVKVDTVDLKDQVKQAAESIATNLNDLLAHESRIIVGEKAVSTEDEGEVSLLRRLELRRRPRQLPSAEGNVESRPLLGNDPPKEK